MCNILFRELVHEVAVQGGFRLVFLRKNENSDKMIVQYTIDCVGYKVYEGNKKKLPKANAFKGKHIGPDNLHVGGIKKQAIKGRKYERRNLDGSKLPRRRYTMLPVEKDERFTFSMAIYFKKEEVCFMLPV
jgi:hypothetical protein